ncbi:hypothetical protein G6F68_004276 [Rhizopus microsporus]|nr:hypothetical protein G6F67_001164 [Rhizopus microsporus]KAG1264542.1 hypothetical protein G6F68_004276 [Rhizopus microsporus]
MSTLTVSSSGIGIAHLPNQKHRIISKKGAHFTLMVCGESGLGKTTFINTLFATTIKNHKVHEKRHEKQLDRTVEIEITKAELEERMFRVKLTVIDTPGFGDYVNNRESWVPIIEFIDDQHESFMLQEQQPMRQGKIDMRVHACLYFIRPTGHSLKPLDIEIMKRLSSRVNLIPVIAKADTLTPKDLAQFKQNVRQAIEANHIKIYSCPIESEDEETTKRNKSIADAFPYAIIGSTNIVQTADGRKVRGREYSWGVAEVENEEHCDFKKLRNLLIRTHMLDLMTTTEDVHYENYRQQQMATRKFGEPKVTKKPENPKFREKEEELRKSFTAKVKAEETRFREWEQQLITERDRLNKDLETQHAQIKQLESELDKLYQQVGRSGTVRRLSASYASLATVRLDSTPAVRTVVMRGFVAEHHKEETGLTSDLLVITTDKRTEKIKEIENNPNVEINWYMSGTVSQFRIRGVVYIIKKGETPVCDWDTVVSSSSIPPTTQPSLALEAFNRHKKINCWEAERLRQFIQLDAGLRRDMLDETDAPDIKQLDIEVDVRSIIYWSPPAGIKSLL